MNSNCSVHYTAKLMITVLLMSLTTTAYGEGGCPPGYYPHNVPGLRGCAPIPGYQANEQSTEVPFPEVVDMWGSIAIDDTAIKGGIGTVTSMKSKLDAERAAMARCELSASNCDVKLSYRNGCGVIAWGDSGYATASASEMKQATRRALGDCNKQNSNCRVFYAECNPSERIH